MPHDVTMFAKNADFYSGWFSMQIEFTLAAHPAADGQDFVNMYLSGLRPEVTVELVRCADSLFRPRTAKLVKQYKEDWDGSQ